MLGGVVGRKAGSVSGYHYSPALQAAGLVWSEDSLNQWLADPKKFVPGARMPVRVLDTPSRRDLVAYLQQASQQHGSPIKAKAAAQNGEY
jgi:cytochrome c2